MMQDLPNLRIGKNVKDSLIRSKVASKWHTILPQYENQRQGIQLRLVPFAAYLISCRFLPPKTEFMCGLDSPSEKTMKTMTQADMWMKMNPSNRTNIPKLFRAGEVTPNIVSSMHPTIHSSTHVSMVSSPESFLHAQLGSEALCCELRWEPLRRIRPATMLLVAACSIGSPKTQAQLKSGGARQGRESKGRKGRTR